MLPVPTDLNRRLHDYGQEHVLAWWDHLDDNQQRQLLAQLKPLDLEQLRRLYANREHEIRLPAADRIAPVPVIRIDADPREPHRLGEEVLRRGEVAVLLVAGGQGSRLGFDHPKGMFPIGPVSNKPLFQIHAEKVLATSRRYGKPVPFLVMTSPATDEETEAFFKEQRHFGLPAEHVHFFCQGTMPALDLATGKLLMEAPGRLFTSPNGHGGTLTALSDSGLLDRMRDQGIRQIFYFQVDNPLVNVADPVFLGHHVRANAEMSSKIVPKQTPTDKVGNMVLIDGRCSIIEYSDLPKELAEQRDEHGKLRIWAGSPAIHYFSVDFLERVTRGHTRIPFHVARKKVPHIDERGNHVEPTKENALKFEMFIFDVLPLADRWTVVETSSRAEFAPLKNATGPDSPPVVKLAITDLAVDWLGRARVTVPPGAPLEISPLYALDAEELAAKVDRNLRITGPTYLH
jgi:UDP-N-acetylglucosamine/UDP-N-acetylgalactosamine diphosphorylase